MTKIIDKIIVSSTAPKEKNILWVDDDSINIPSKGKWKKVSGGSSGGNGIDIVESVDKLDKNAPVGSIASVVTPGTVDKINISELPQADSSIVDMENYIIDASGCPQVQGISVIAPESAIPVTVSFLSEMDMVMFLSESFGMMGGNESAIIIGLFPVVENGYVTALLAILQGGATAIENQLVLFSITDGIVTVDYDAINLVNQYINGLHYIGSTGVLQDSLMPDEVLSIYDKIVQVISGVPSKANIYVKKDKWEELYKKDFDKLASDLDKTKTTAESKADKVAITTYSSWKGLQPNVYTTYTISSTNTVTINLAAIADTSNYNEYILELKCTNTPSSVTFNNADGTIANIIWANGIEPTFEAGMTYIISIVNGFGVYSMFANS